MRGFIRRSAAFHYRVGDFDVREFLAAVGDETPGAPRILDVGSGGRTLTDRTIKIDVVRQPNVDILADAGQLPVKSGSMDGVAITDVLMYVDDPFAVAREVHRVLRSGGIVWAAEPFVHPDGTRMASNFRFSEKGMRAVFRDFEKVRSGRGRGPYSTALPIIAHVLPLALSFNNFTLYRIWFWLFVVILSPLKYLDRFLVKYDRVPQLVFTNAYFVGRKS